MDWVIPTVINIHVDGMNLSDGSCAYGSGVDRDIQCIGYGSKAEVACANGYNEGESCYQGNLLT